MLTNRAPRYRVMAAALAVASATLVGGGTAVANAHETCGGLAVTIDGTTGDDVIEGTAGADVIAGGGGDDLIHGRGGDDVICGNGGRDTIYGNGGNDVLYGNASGDRLRGGKGDDTLRGGKGHDRLFGNDGTDIARGGSYSDVCRAEDEGNCEMDYRGERDEEEWRELVEQYFGDIDETDNALVIIGCESNGDPFAKNPNSTASGLFQFIASTWDRWNPQTPDWAGESVFHPEANTATARRLFDAHEAEGDWGWTAWNCKRLLDDPTD